MRKIDKEAMKELLEMETVSVCNSLSSLLGRAVKISITKVSEVTVKELPEQLPHFHVILSGMRCGEGIEAGQIYVYGKEDIMKLTNFVMGLPTTASSPLDEIALSTIREVVTQSIQAGVAELGDFLGREMKVTFSGIETADHPAKAAEILRLWGDDEVLLVTFALIVEGVASMEIYGAYSMKTADIFGMTELAEEEIVYRQEKKKGMIAVQEVTFPELKYSLIDHKKDHFNSEHDRLLEIELDVSVRIGSTLSSIKDILNLKEGQVLTLDKQAGSLADVVVNGRLIGKGDVLVTGEHFGARITEIIAKEK